MTSFAPRFGKAAGRQPSKRRKTTRKIGVSLTIGRGISVHWNLNWSRSRRPAFPMFGQLCCAWVPSALLPQWSPPRSCSCSVRNKTLTRSPRSAPRRLSVSPTTPRRLRSSRRAAYRPAYQRWPPKHRLPQIMIHRRRRRHKSPLPPQMSAAQVAVAAPPQLTRGKVVTAPPAKTEAPPPQIASLPAPNAPAPAAHEPTSPRRERAKVVPACRRPWLSRGLLAARQFAAKPLIEAVRTFRYFQESSAVKVASVASSLTFCC